MQSKSKRNKKRTKPAAKKISMRRWMAVTEELTRCWVPGNLKKASHVFDRLLTSEEQLALVREVVETRTAELVRAYPNVIDVGFGFRRRRRRGSEKYQIVRTPCLHFVVKRKWAKDSDKDPELIIPKRFFAYCWVKGERRLCAIPTDVEDARVFAVTRSQSREIGVTYREDSMVGAIACGIQRGGGDRQAYALSCRHVLSLSDRYGREPTWGAKVRVATAEGPALLGETLAIAGLLQEVPAISFDAQLLQVMSLDALRLGLGGVELLSYVSSYQDVPDRFTILTPHGEVGCSFYGFKYNFPLYTLLQIGLISHMMILMGVPVTPIKPGDSGSPVVSQAQNGIFVGMLIARGGDDKGNCFAYIIPAWQLFNPENYIGATNSEEWKIFNP